MWVVGAGVALAVIILPIGIVAARASWVFVLLAGQMTALAVAAGATRAAALCDRDVDGRPHRLLANLGGALVLLLAAMVICVALFASPSWVRSGRTLFLAGWSVDAYLVVLRLCRYWWLTPAAASREVPVGGRTIPLVATGPGDIDSPA
jgi:hypothetical protein